MNKYTLYCTMRQAKKAIELGAPIKKKEIQLCDNAKHFFWYNGFYYNYPTAKQMISWLEEQGYNITTNSFSAMVEYENIGLLGMYESNKKQSILEAIDKALEYLMNNKK